MINGAWSVTMWTNSDLNLNSVRLSFSITLFEMKCVEQSRCVVRLIWLEQYLQVALLFSHNRVYAAQFPTIDFLLSHPYNKQTNKWSSIFQLQTNKHVSNSVLQRILAQSCVWKRLTKWMWMCMHNNTHTYGNFLFISIINVNEQKRHLCRTKWYQIGCHFESLCHHRLLFNQKPIQQYRA